jgi:hypothetical protein
VTKTQLKKNSGAMGLLEIIHVNLEQPKQQTRGEPERPLKPEAEGPPDSACTSHSVSSAGTNSFLKEVCQDHGQP